MENDNVCQETAEQSLAFIALAMLAAHSPSKIMSSQLNIIKKLSCLVGIIQMNC